MEAQLATLLSAEESCLAGLLDTLTQEYEALLSADVEAVEAATVAKNKALKNQRQRHGRTAEIGSSALQRQHR